MAAKEMYDYLSTVAADYTAVTLNIAPSRVLKENGLKNQVVRKFDDGSEERISFSTAFIFYVEIEWEGLTESDAGTIFDFYFDTAKGNGSTRSFQWTHPTDGHTYTVRFDSQFSRDYRAEHPGSHAIPTIRLRVLGKV